MPKRKRDEASESSLRTENTNESSLKRQNKLCAQRISTAQKPLTSALRLAAGFERQKHSRRKKTAQSNNNEKGVSRLDAEYAKLKSLDLEKLAEQHLRKTIGKVKSLRDSEVLPESVRQIDKGEQDAVVLNVQARLFKVDAVRKVVDEVIEDLKEIVKLDEGGERPPKDEVKKQKKARRADADEAIVEDGEEDDSDAFAAFDACIAAPSSAEEESEDSLSEGDRPPSVADSESESEDALDEELEPESGDADTIPFHDFDSEDEDDEGSDSVASEELISKSDMESESDSDGTSILLPKAKRKAIEPEKASESTFLPSLSHAAYFSGSESEASDLDMDLAPRKNRRGQKARQKIWEQKYRDKAKHLQKQDRGKGWDPKRGAVGDDKSRKGKPSGRGPEKSGANANPLGPRKTKRDDSGPLHPSWEAAKAAKEKKIDMKPQGKKVVFD